MNPIGKSGSSGSNPLLDLEKAAEKVVETVVTDVAKAIEPKPATPAPASATPVTSSPQAPVDQFSPADANDSAATTGASANTVQLPTDPKDMAIVCPVLGALVAQGKVQVSPDGTIKLDDLRNVFGNDFKMTPALAEVTAGTGYAANGLDQVFHNIANQQMDVFDLRTGALKHPSDSAILTAGQFDEQKFDALVSHAQNGVMTLDSFSQAIAANEQRDSDQGLAKAYAFGTNASEVEFGALLTVFGTRDAATGEVGIPVDQLRALYQDKQLPPVVGGTVGLPDVTVIQQTLHVKVDAALAASAFKSVATATGLAQAGARISAGEPDAAANPASIGAGKSAACPYLNGTLQMPSDPNQVVTVHLNANDAGSNTASASSTNAVD
jgi:hypothetical protein